MVSLYLFIVSVFVGCYGQQEQSSPLTVTMNTTVIRGIEGCPTQQIRNVERLSPCLPLPATDANRGKL